MKNKIALIFPIIMITFAILLSISTSSFASFDFTYNEQEYSLPDLPSECEGNNYIIAYDNKNSLYKLLIAINPATMTHDVTNMGYKGVAINGDYMIYQKGSQNTTWSKLTSGTGDGSSLQSYGTEGVILYSNFDLLDKSGNLVFQGAPQKQEGLVLVPIVEQQEATMKMVLQEILGILPVILVTIVGLISLRKALQLLSQILHRA